jgi:hypothetical protein
MGGVAPAPFCRGKQGRESLAKLTLTVLKIKVKKIVIFIIKI